MQNKHNETGRSMIEMLGVLAIIGVLSVGGIAGYSKAMMQYKINKTVDQVSQIVGNVRTLYGSQKSYSGVSNKDIWKKAHLIPDEMWNTDRTSVENAFGGVLSLNFSFGKNGGYDKAFGIHLESLPEEACMAIATYDWGSGSSSGLLGVSVNYGTVGEPYMKESSYSSGWYTEGSNAFAVPNGSSVSVPMPVNIAATACQSNDSNSINLIFY